MCTKAAILSPIRTNDLSNIWFKIQLMAYFHCRTQIRTRAVMTLFYDVAHSRVLCTKAAILSPIRTNDLSNIWFKIQLMAYFHCRTQIRTRAVMTLFYDVAHSRVLCTKAAILSPIRTNDLSNIWFKIQLMAYFHCRTQIRTRAVMTLFYDVAHSRVLCTKAAILSPIRTNDLSNIWFKIQLMAYFHCRTQIRTRAVMTLFYDVAHSRVLCTKAAILSPIRTNDLSNIWFKIQLMAYFHCRTQIRTRTRIPVLCRYYGKGIRI